LAAKLKYEVSDNLILRRTPFDIDLEIMSPSRKMLCAPIYRKPQEMREAILQKLESLKNLQSVPWINPSTIFLNKEGLFLLEAVDEGSLTFRVQKKLLAMANLFHSPGSDTSERQRRLHYARRRLLISLVAHAWLWERPKLWDGQGNPVASQNKIVLAPEDILKFLRDTRVHREGCPCEDIRGFLETVREIPLVKDTSKWNVMGVTACLWWDKLHDLKGGIWCSCCIGSSLRSGMPGTIGLTQDSPPPYHEAELPPYNQNCPVKGQGKEGSKGEMVGTLKRINAKESML
jgi:hypothetical protein